MTLSDEIYTDFHHYHECVSTRCRFRIAYQPGMLSPSFNPHWDINMQRRVMLGCLASLLRKMLLDFGYMTNRPRWIFSYSGSSQRHYYSKPGDPDKWPTSP